MATRFTRRRALRTVALGSFAAGVRLSSLAATAPDRKGLVAGELHGAAAGNKVLKEGGNAIDAVVAGALASGVGAPNHCGIGGYGGHMVIALAGGKKITAIDFNSAAATAVRPDIFAHDPESHAYGWLSAGVPGTLAGLQMALDRYGTRRFSQLVEPAINLAVDGIVITPGLSKAIASVANRLGKNHASGKLFFRNGKALEAGETLRNPDLAGMLQRLARDNSVEAFYRGDVARQIAADFEKNDGLVTVKDLAAYRAREVAPLQLEWNGFTVFAAPLTAGSITPLQGLNFLKAVDWHKLSGAARTHALIETLRVTWQDRLKFLGDPEHSEIPINRLLSDQYAHDIAERIATTVKEGKLRTASQSFSPSIGKSGTVHLNAMDGHGNVVALTHTHGNSFGACVTVAGMGLTLGHGMSRFERQPGHPNSPGPGKRPLHNMCPAIVMHGGDPVLAVGATGGRLIPSTVFNVLAHYVGLTSSAQNSLVAPRVHTESGPDLRLEARWPQEETDRLKSLGYLIQTGASATIQMLSIDRRRDFVAALAR